MATHYGSIQPSRLRRDVPWSPGMTMVGAMFKNSLKSKLDAVCTELAAYVTDTPSTDRDHGREGEVSYQTSSSVQMVPHESRNA